MSPEPGPPQPREQPEISGPAFLRLIGLGALIGIPAALAGAGFLALVHELEDLLWTELPDALGESSPPWYLVVGLPVVGAVVVLIALRLLPGEGGHAPLGGLSMAPTPLRFAPGVALAALGSLPFGAVLGPEAPLIAIGSIVGLTLTPFVKLGTREQTVLGTAGSFSAISALFGGPLVASVLLLEAGVGLGAALIPALLPGLVAAGIGYTIFTGLGDWGGLNEQTLTIPDLPAYDTTYVPDLLLAIAIGIVAAVIVAALHRIAVAIDGPLKGRVGLAGTLFGGALLVGLLALLADALGANSQDVLFSGQTAIPAIITETDAEVVLVTLVAKALAFAICLGCGFRGGPVFPSIFIGVALGALCVIAFDTNPTLAVAVGAAAGMAAQTRLLFAPLILATLLVGLDGLDTAPAAVLGSAAAWVTATVIERRAGRAGPAPDPARPGVEGETAVPRMAPAPSAADQTSSDRLS